VQGPGKCRSPFISERHLSQVTCVALIYTRTNSPPRTISRSSYRIDGGLTENDGHENDERSKLQDMKLQDKNIVLQCTVHF